MERRKIYYTVGDLAEMFDVNVSLIRHWEGQFDAIKPKRNKRGTRLFSQQDVDNFKLIYYLVKERGMTLDGARRALKKGSVVNGSSIERDAKIMERLQSLRSLLVELRDMLKEGDESTIQLNSFAEDDDKEIGKEIITEEIEVKEAIPIPTEDATPQELFAFYEQRLF